jgi:hypothetical protein
MRKQLMRIVLLVIVSLVFVCGQPPAIAETKIGYLKNNIHFQEKAARGGQMVYRASYANYVDPGAGHGILPINSKVEVSVTRGWRGRRLQIIDINGGRSIDFEYNERNMGMSMDEYSDLIVSAKKVSLKGLSSVDKKGIREGKVYTGMSRNGVRMALGYPARHKTPNLKYHSWTYWRDRWRTMLVIFNDKGTVQRIQ